MPSKPIIIATDNTIQSIVNEEILKYGGDTDLNHIEVSQVTTMYALFSYSRFNGDISKWNTGNVTDMSFMFFNSTFNGDISKWDTIKVRAMYKMFLGSDFNGDISNWNVQPTVKKSFMFVNSPLETNLPHWYASTLYTHEQVVELMSLAHVHGYKSHDTVEAGLESLDTLGSVLNILRNYNIS